MPRISRRHLIASGIAFSGTSFLSYSAWARATSVSQSGGAIGAAGAALPDAVRETLLFDFGWRFKFGHGTDPAKDLGFGLGQADFSKTGDFKPAKAGFDDSSWRALDLPHDWAVELPFEHDDNGGGDSQLQSHGYKPIGRRYPENSVGWYRREFEIPASDAGRRIRVEFEGMFRDALVFVNGCFVGRNDNGYAPFGFDLTDCLAYGKKNYILVRVDASFGDGWFYEGAGIYRHVWLVKTDPVHLGRWESTIRPTLNGESAVVALSTVVQNESTKTVASKVIWKIVDPNGVTVATAESSRQPIAPDGTSTYVASARLTKPALWCCGRSPSRTFTPQWLPLRLTGGYPMLNG